MSITVATPIGKDVEPYTTMCLKPDNNGKYCDLPSYHSLFSDCNFRSFESDEPVVAFHHTHEGIRKLRVVTAEDCGLKP